MRLGVGANERESIDLIGWQEYFGNLFSERVIIGFMASFARDEKVCDNYMSRTRLWDILPAARLVWLGVQISFATSRYPAIFPPLTKP
jgi:hypothetical protein